MVGGHHGERGARACNGGLGAEPQRGPGTEPVVRGQGGFAPPPEAESILVIGCPTEPANLAPVRENTMFCYGPLVSELGGPRVHGAPNPVIGGAGAPPALRLRRACKEYQLIFQALFKISTRLNKSTCNVSPPINLHRLTIGTLAAAASFSSAL